MVKTLKKRARSASPAAPAVESAAAKSVDATSEPPKKKKKLVKTKKMVKKAVEEPAEKQEQESEDEEQEHEEAPAAKEAAAPQKEAKEQTTTLAKNSESTNTGESFASLGLNENLLKGLEEAGYTSMFEIQKRAIPYLLNGEDVLGAAKTGSGKTLAFLVPMIDTLAKTKFIQRNGTGVLVLSPTRELAEQIYNETRSICGHLSQTHGVVLGGMNRQQEAKKLQNGVNVLVATPGRLLDHMQNTKGFVYHNLLALVIDEADRILEIGFEEELNAILKLLPRNRQTALFSATQTRKVADLVRMSMKKPVFVEVKSKDELATREGLEQGYVVTNADKRFLLLFTFLKKNLKKKVMVFMSSVNAVKFYTDLLNYIDVKVDSLHGQMKQAQRQAVFGQFSTVSAGILICTDVAARGLDIPKVDWIVQYDPPDDPREYIHRVGRTARGEKGVGKALLFLLPEELAFLRYLKSFNIPVNEFTFPESKVANIQNQLERIIEKSYHLHRESRDGYRSYIHAYAAHALKDCFEVTKLDLAKVAKSFGFGHPPKVELNIKHRTKKGKQNLKEGSAATSSHGFSAENPYGKRAEGDKRQFSY